MAKTIKLKDLAQEIKGNKNISKNKIERIICAIPKVIGNLLLNKKEVCFSCFLKLGFRIAKDRIVKSSITKETLHIPQHLRFKGVFYEKFKNFINQ